METKREQLDKLEIERNQLIAEIEEIKLNMVAISQRIEQHEQMGDSDTEKLNLDSANELSALDTSMNELIIEVTKIDMAMTMLCVGGLD
ncbi:hypothetical protein QT327_21230 [Olivibacter sp. 47]|uniref:hypothetical protein n=1 Tax=Olivibacter sp. 47 TaxID=3056486 RepID=UPI0025A38A5D|nr:hypothetical protein [Olivibacter sp. 47]MDM8176839.1 hypothetical protein [Olivibacter sp. 47]